MEADLLASKKKAAGKERANDYLVGLEKNRVLANNKKEHHDIYKKKYASADEAARWQQRMAAMAPAAS